MIMNDRKRYMKKVIDSDITWNEFVSQHKKLFSKSEKIGNPSDDVKYDFILMAIDKLERRMKDISDSDLLGLFYQLLRIHSFNFPEFSDRSIHDYVKKPEMYDLVLFFQSKKSTRMKLLQNLELKKNSDYDKIRQKTEDKWELFPQYKLPPVILPWDEELMKDDTLILKNLLDYLSMVLIPLEIIKISRRKSILQHKCDSLHDNPSPFDFFMPYKKLALKLCEFVD